MHNEKKYCPVCQKRLKLTAIKCKCNNYYCNIHKYSDMHDCSYNYISAAQDIIKKNNPKIISTKVNNI